MVDAYQQPANTGADTASFFTIPEQYRDGAHEFKTPTKQIITPDDLERFKKMDTLRDYVTFVSEAQSAVKSKSIAATPKAADKFQPLIAYIERLVTLVDEVPPIQQKMRFGNTAFKTWHQRMSEISQTFLKEFLPQAIAGAAVELHTYLLDSYGSNVRIDYGSGHEMAFFFFLFALHRLGLYATSELESVVHNVFYAYIRLMRKIQLTYWLEPAGSQGVWGIDDYHFLPFLFGAAEIVNHDEITSPNDIHSDTIVEKYYKDYMYMDCIRFIKQVKKGPFHEHSPMLNDISGASSWTKVMQGMVKMYQAKVLLEFPVIKHVYFGTIIPFK